MASIDTILSALHSESVKTEFGMLALERLSGALKLSCWPATTKGYRGGIQVPIPSRVDLVGLPGPHGRNACAGTVFERDHDTLLFKKKLGPLQTAMWRLGNEITGAQARKWLPETPRHGMQ